LTKKKKIIRRLFYINMIQNESNADSQFLTEIMNLGC